MLNLQVKIRDCWVLVGPYPSCTQTSTAATGIFEGGVGNPTRNLWVGYPFTLLLRVKASPPAIMHFKSSTLKIVLNQLNPIRWSCSQQYRQSRPCPLPNDNHEHRLEDNHWSTSEWTGPSARVYVFSVTTLHWTPHHPPLHKRVVHCKQQSSSRRLPWWKFMSIIVKFGTVPTDTIHSRIGLRMWPAPMKKGRWQGQNFL